jgi:hypothetical protein
MSNTVRILRSTTAGNVPSSLVSGQIAVNESDGRLYYRSGAGAVAKFGSVEPYASTASLPAAGSSATLYLITSSGRLYRWADGTVYAEVGAIGGISDSVDGGTYA